MFVQRFCVHFLLVVVSCQLTAWQNSDVCRVRRCALLTRSLIDRIIKVAYVVVLGEYMAQLGSVCRNCFVAFLLMFCVCLPFNDTNSRRYIVSCHFFLPYF